jgi:hypothetical protein
MFERLLNIAQFELKVKSDYDPHLEQNTADGPFTTNTRGQEAY